MVQAYFIETEAAERYADFADQMEVHNNRDVADLFRKLAQLERLHAEQIRRKMRWTTLPPPAAGWLWRGADAPEAAPVTELHYLMQPYHALEVALRCEERARDFFDGMARSVAPAEVRRTARAMAREEREHIRLIRAWMKKVEKPPAGWDRDFDPPVPAE